MFLNYCCILSSKVFYFSLTFPKVACKFLNFQIGKVCINKIYVITFYGVFKGPFLCFRLTVFASEHIPINIVETVEASAFYRQYLGSSLLGIPIGIEERLLHWPVLKPKDMRTLGTGQRQSCADVVLSSAGMFIIHFKIIFGDIQ